jgi:hypothetical protein
VRARDEARKRRGWVPVLSDRDLEYSSRLSRGHETEEVESGGHIMLWCYSVREQLNMYEKGGREQEETSGSG